MKRRKLVLKVKDKVIFMIIFIFMGTICFINLQYFITPINQNNAIDVCAEFSNYNVKYLKKRLPFTKLKYRIESIHMNFYDDLTLYIDSMNVDDELLNELESIERNTWLDMKVHPNTKHILELYVGENKLINFEDSQKNIRIERILNFIACFIFYILAGLFLYKLIKHYRNRLNKLNK